MFNHQMANTSNVDMMCRCYFMHQRRHGLCLLASITSVGSALLPVLVTLHFASIASYLVSHVSLRICAHTFIHTHSAHTPAHTHARTTLTHARTHARTHACMHAHSPCLICCLAKCFKQLYKTCLWTTN